MTRTTGRRAAVLLLPLTALLIIAPMWVHGCSCGHDFDFHLLSWMEAARSWHQGVLVPHWVAGANYGAGEPRLVFYPPASWLLGAVLGSVAGWTAAPLLFIFVCSLGAGLNMLWLAREWVPHPFALLAASLYMANPYAMFVIYERAAFGELLAAVWIPLIVLFALRERKSTAPLALALAAVWVTNAPAAVMASYMLALLAAVVSICERSPRAAVRAAVGMGIGLALAGVYIVPAAYEQRWVQIARAIGPGMRVQDSFLFAHTGETFHDQVLRTASWIAVAEFVVALVAAFILLRRPRTRDRTAVIAMAALLPVLLWLQFAASNLIWSYAPHLKFLQFPWRWLLVVSVVGCVLVGMAVQHAPLPPVAGRAIAALCLLAMIFLGPALFFQPCDQEDAVAGQIANFRSGAGVEGTDEYTPQGTDNAAIQQGLPPVRVLRTAGADTGDDTTTSNPPWHPDPAATVPSQIQIERWNSEDRRFVVRSACGGFAVLRLMDYPAWRVTLNGSAVSTRRHRDDGLMVIPLSASPGLNQVIDVRWSATRDVIAGRLVSCAGLVLLLLMVTLERRRSRLAQVSSG